MPPNGQRVRSAPLELNIRKHIKNSTLQIENITIDVSRKNIKNLHLRVYPPDGQVRISAPLRISDESLRLFALSKLNWIIKHREKFAGQKREQTLNYVSGESLLIEGNTYVLLVEQAKATPSVTLNGNEILLKARPGSTAEKRKSLLREWQRQELKTRIEPLILKWSRMMDVSPSFWGVKRMKTKWGSCHTRAGRIWLNLDLAAVTHDCLEYVIVHELTHLLEGGHGTAFKRIMDQYLPDWRERKKNLNLFSIPS